MRYLLAIGWATVCLVLGALAALCFWPVWTVVGAAGLTFASLVAFFGIVPLLDNEGPIVELQRILTDRRKRKALGSGELSEVD